MSSSLVVRRTFRFPGINLAGQSFALSVPADPEVGSSVDIGLDIVASSNTPHVTTSAAASQKFILPRIDGMAPIGIAIAGDSAIAACNISLSGVGTAESQHRLSPGNPLLGSLDKYDFATVSIPSAIPTFVVPDNAGAGAAWDAVPMFSAELGATIACFPLRLELLYGCPLPIRAHERAPYYAHLNFYSDSGPSEHTTVICVDGRRRIDVKIVVPNATTTLVISEIEGFKDDPITNFDDFTSRAMALNDAGATSLLLGAGLNVFSFAGNPMTLIRIELDDSVGGANVFSQVRVIAWDN